MASRGRESVGSLWEQDELYRIFDSMKFCLRAYFELPRPSILSALIQLPDFGYFFIYFFQSSAASSKGKSTFAFILRPSLFFFWGCQLFIYS